MPSAFLANLILCCAAILLVPQALECCAGHPRTVLEGLSQGVDGHHHPTDAHAADERRERLVEQIDRMVSGTGSIESERTPGIALPTGHEMGEAPGVGAASLAGERGDDVPATAGQFVRLDQAGPGRIDRPATPPPRRSV